MYDSWIDISTMWRMGIFNEWRESVWLYLKWGSFYPLHCGISTILIVCLLFCLHLSLVVAHSQNEMIFVRCLGEIFTGSTFYKTFLFRFLTKIATGSALITKEIIQYHSLIRIFANRRILFVKDQKDSVCLMCCMIECSFMLNLCTFFSQSVS